MKTEYTPEMAHAAAKRGAAWMDRHCPDWITEIDLENLDLAGSLTCVLGQSASCLLGWGQTWHGYSEVVFHFWPRAGHRAATRLGFNIPAAIRWTNDDKLEEVAYEMLTIAWLELIQARRDAAA